MTIVKRLVQIPYTFLLLNWAAVAGLYSYTRGHRGPWELVRTPKVAIPELRHL